MVRNNYILSACLWSFSTSLLYLQPCQSLYLVIGQTNEEIVWVYFTSFKAEVEK